jgi:Family of unknown function (DUF6527)
MTRLQIAEPTGRYRRELRRFCVSHGDRHDHWHDATVFTGEVSEAEHIEVHGDLWFHDDPRWPATCSCGYEFAEGDEWQLNDNLIYRLPDGREFTTWAGCRDAPPGAMVRADWYPGGDRGESWLVVLPDGGTWITTQQATSGGYWSVTGQPPNITVEPSIFHNAPAGWHGFIRAGELVPV